MRRTLLAILAAVVAVLGGGTTTASATRSHEIRHIILIVEENHAFSEVQGHMPYLEGLAHRRALATNLHAITHPSLPNYMAMLAGHELVSNDCGVSVKGCRQGKHSIFDQARSWAGWSESMEHNCQRHNARPYVVHHAPAPFFTRLHACPSNDIPLKIRHVPKIRAEFTFVSPNLNHDGHDGTLKQADDWLQKAVHQLQRKRAYRKGHTLIEITFDEGSGRNQRVYTAFVHPSLNHVTVQKRANLYSILRLNESLLGVPLLGHADGAPKLRKALGL